MDKKKQPIKLVRQFNIALTIGFSFLSILSSTILSYETYKREKKTYIEQKPGYFRCCH